MGSMTDFSPLGQLTRKRGAIPEFDLQTGMGKPVNTCDSRGNPTYRRHPLAGVQQTREMMHLR